MTKEYVIGYPGPPSVNGAQMPAAVGDIATDSAGVDWYCTVGGTPGTWVSTNGTYVPTAGAALGQAIRATGTGLTLWKNDTTVKLDAAGADPSGTADSTAAFLAAYSELSSEFNSGVLEWGSGQYKVGNLQSLSQGYGVIGAGSQSTVLLAQNAGSCLRLVQTNWSTVTATHYGSDTNAHQIPIGGHIAGLAVDGSAAGAGAAGIHFGDLVGLEFDDVNVRMFQGAGSIGFWNDNVFGHSERLSMWNCHGWYNQVGLQFDVNSGLYAGSLIYSGASTYSNGQYVMWTDNNLYQAVGSPTAGTAPTGPSETTPWLYIGPAPTSLASTDYSNINIEVIAESNQDGVVVNNGAHLAGTHLNIKGNFQAGAGNTGSMLRLVGHSAAVSGISPGYYSLIQHGVLNMQCECDGVGGGNVGHQTITFTSSSRNLITATGNLSFGGTATASNYTSTNGGPGAFAYSGRIYGDTVLGGSTIEAGSAVFGPGIHNSTVAPFSGGNTLTVDLRSGDYWTATLSGNVSTVALSNPSSQGREITVLLKQAASGGPYAVTGWPGSIIWNNGTAPTMPTTASAVLTVTLRTADQTTWYGDYTLSATAGGDLTGTFPFPTLAAIGSATGPIGGAATIPVVTIDAKGRVTALTSIAASGATNFELPGTVFQTGRWYPGVNGTGTASVVAQNTLFALPFGVNASHTFPAIGLNATVAGTGGTLRFGIYADNGSGYPGSLVVDYGTVSAVATGVIQIVANQALTPGLYWLCVVGQGGTVQPTLTTANNLPAYAWFGSSAAGAAASTNGLFVAGVSGALPGSYPGSASLAGANTLPLIQVQA